MRLVFPVALTSCIVLTAHVAHAHSGADGKSAVRGLLFALVLAGLAWFARARSTIQR